MVQEKKGGSHLRRILGFGKEMDTDIGLYLDGGGSDEGDYAGCCHDLLAQENCHFEKVIKK